MNAAVGAGALHEGADALHEGARADLAAGSGRGEDEQHTGGGGESTDVGSQRVAHVDPSPSEGPVAPHRSMHPESSGSKSTTGSRDASWSAHQGPASGISGTGAGSRAPNSESFLQMAAQVEQLKQAAEDIQRRALPAWQGQVSP